MLLQVRNESTDNFLELLKQWERLCKSYLSDLERTLKFELEGLPEAEDCKTQSHKGVSSGEYEVSCLVDICYGDPNESGKSGLHFKVLTTNVLVLFYLCNTANGT